VGWLKGAALNVRTDDRKLLSAILGGAYAGVFAGRFAVHGGGAFHALAWFLFSAAAVHLFSSFSGRRCRRRRSFRFSSSWGC